MKKLALTAICLSFIFVINSSAQNESPFKLAFDFLKLAQKNDFEMAQDKIDTTFFGKEKLEQVKLNFQTISKGEFKIFELFSQQFKTTKASFIFKSMGKDNQVATCNVELNKTANGWKITNFETYLVGGAKVYGDYGYQPFFPNSPTRKYGQLSPITTPLYQPDKNPAKYFSEPYHPNEGKNKFQGYVPKFFPNPQ